MVKIIYASLTGNTQRVCEFVSENLKKGGIVNEILLADMLDHTVFETAEKFILATSTWEDGQVNILFESFYQDLLNGDLNGKKIWLLGLGDKSYGQDNFCRAMDLVKTRVEKVGGEVVGDILRLDGSIDTISKTELISWLKDIR